MEGDDPDADDAPDGVRASALIEDLVLVPGLYKLDGYTMLPRKLAEEFVLKPCGPDDDEAGNFLKFPYDWRRDVRAIARRLRRVVRRKLDLWREDSANDQARTIFLVHSMGGLVAQYYLEALEGWSDCRALISFGTPYRGAVQAVQYLVNGYKMFRMDFAETMRSFPSTYQLLPRYPVVATEAGGRARRVAEVADRFGLDPAGVRALVQLHEELDAAWDRHKADERYRNDSYLTIPVIGTDQPTLSSATWDGTKLRTGPELPPGQEGIPGAGDGTVPQVSAIPLTQSTPKDFRGYFVAEQHASLQNQEFVLNDLVKRIKLLLSPNLAAVRGEVPPSAPGAPLNLELDDIYGADEPVIVRASAPGAGLGDAPALEARVERADDGVAVTYPLELGEDGRASRHLVGLKPGLYRVEVGVAGKDAARFLPVHTVFEIAEEEAGGLSLS